MGRRKIEIKAIKDDRNRSVTFLKRKGGLFKKAHELSVLCSVDVAVIIFGANKKLYEFSSGNIQEYIERHQFYGPAHEHKGPADFQGKRDGDGSDDEEVDEAALDEQMTAPEHVAHMQPQPGYPPQMRHAPSTSPPLGNGVMGYHPRPHTPQPGMGSRPSSRNAGMIQRPSSNLSQHRPPPHGPQVPNGYTSYLQQQQPPQGPYQAPHPPQQHSLSVPPPPHQPQPHPQYPYSQAPQQQPLPAHPQYMTEDQRRMTGPPPFRPGDARGSTPQPVGQQPPQSQQAPQSQPHPPPRPSQSPPQQQRQQQGQQGHPEQRSDLLQVQQPQPKPMAVKSKSIFTPIDDNRSMLAGAWGFTPSDAKAETPIKQEAMPRKSPIGGAAAPDANQADGADGAGTSVPPPPRYPQPQRTTSTASLSGEKRPNLKLQIPSEAGSDTATGSALDGAAVSSPKPMHSETRASGSGGSGDRGSSNGPTGAGAGGNMPNHRATEGSHGGGSGMVLPPPSPSASALLSAGAQGPPNPFARPLPPNAGAGPGQPSGPPGGSSNNAGAGGSTAGIETPISALPSRVLGDQFLPSPSTFYSEWGFGANGGGRSAGGLGESNMLPSPLNWQTPVAGQGPGFGGTAEKEDEGRKREREGGEEGDAKRLRA